MRAVVHDRYGPPEVLRVTEVERPVPKDDEVLVRVNASTVTRTDTGLRSLEYPFSRLITGIRRPKRTIAGMEFAGRVEDVGTAVTDFRVGDEVFGIGGGANAEYVTVRESGVIAQKPTGLTYEETAAVPDGSLLALTCLQPASPLRGKNALVYGAAGSIGTAAVQLLAHHFEAEVTAVCDTKDLEIVRSLGAQDVLDRFGEDFTKNGEAYDVIFDAVGKHSFRRSRRSLKPRGIYITADLGFMYHVPLLAVVTRFVGSRRAAIGIGRYRKDDLVLVKELVEAGAYRPVIDRSYALEDVVEAVRYVEAGQKTGNVVLRVSDARGGDAAASRA
ncbi:MAG TPA: NAD(P)-dependent alcohol dehydrogenase [Gaiellaceae bacterium]|nr:NAD(P)-dependent alcohol dehydrogenase [Gaiellaceae bacterium]